MNPQKQKTKIKMRSAKKYKEIFRMDCLNSQRFWLMKVLQQSLGETQSREVMTLPSHLMNFQLEPRAKVEPGSGQHSAFLHFPKITRASCRRRAGTVVPRAEHFGDLITADHKVLSEECESRNNHRYAVVVQDLAKQWIQSYPCKSKSSQETQKNLMKFLAPTRKPKSHLHRRFPGIWQVFRGIILKSLYVNTTQIRNKWDCRKSSAQSERRDICGAVAVRSGERTVGGFHGMLLLSAKHSRSLV